MTKKKDPLAPRPVEPLIKRQRNLWNIAEAIELAQARNQPLPLDISEWLHRCLKNIAYGKDANEVLNVHARQGARKDGFKNACLKKLQNGFIAASTKPGKERKKTADAIKVISEALPTTKQSTFRKNWNSKTANRKIKFTLGKE
ncbi:MAG: hypothetical protein ACKOBF_07450 [Limnohabitans sp.]